MVADHVELTLLSGNVCLLSPKETLVREEAGQDSSNTHMLLPAVVKSLCL